MLLTIPDVGVTPGPQWAQILNDAFFRIDSHTHAPGEGAPVDPASLVPTGDLDMAGFNIINTRAYRSQDQGAPLGLPSDINELYTVLGDLYFNNGIGTPIKITAGGGLNTLLLKGFTGDYGTSLAEAFYDAADTLYTFFSAPPTLADIKSRFGFFQVVRALDNFPLVVRGSNNSFPGAGYGISLIAGNPDVVDNDGGFVQLLGGVSLGTDRDGGKIQINAGASTGTGTSTIEFTTPTPGGTGAGTNLAATRMEIITDLTMFTNIATDTPNTNSIGALGSQFLDLYAGLMWGDRVRAGDKTAALQVPTSNDDLYTRHGYNCVVAWGTSSGAAGGLLPVHYNVTSITLAGPGVYNIVLDFPVSTDSVVIATSRDATPTPGMITTYFTSTTTLVANIFDDTGTPAQVQFNFAIIGTTV